MSDDVTVVPFTPEDDKPGVVVNEPDARNIQVDQTPADGKKTQEELDHEAAMIKKADEGTNTATHKDDQLFAGKFKTQEDMNKGIMEALKKKHNGDMEAAYKELAGNLSNDSSDAANDPQNDSTDDSQNADADADDQTVDQTDNTDDSDSTALNMDHYVQEYVKDGKISEESYESLNKAGFDRAMVDTYMVGIKGQQQALMGRVGGEDSFYQMTEWAGENMSEGDIKLFNDDLNSGQMPKMERAMDFLKQKYDGAGQRVAPTKRIEPEGGEITPGVTGYTHLDQFKADQANPLYKTSAAFRAQVKEKLRRGSI
jgi:hypothetical protein